MAYRRVKTVASKAMVSVAVMVLGSQALAAADPVDLPSGSSVSQSDSHVSFIQQLESLLFGGSSATAPRPTQHHPAVPADPRNAHPAPGAPVSERGRQATPSVVAPELSMQNNTPQSQPDRSSIPRRYVMKFDGSTGKELPGDQLINWETAQNTIRAYMNANDHGVANKTRSPYIDDVSRVIAEKTPAIVAECTAQKEAGKKPAVVFDADDTTLWTYDMEDSYMHFSFSPELQQQWFDKNELPAVPGMVNVVKQLHAAGCTIVGLTGRNKGQEDYTLANLEHAGYLDDNGSPLFTKDLYFTKYRQRDEAEPYLYDTHGGYCSPSKEKCTTVEYKAGTRRHVEADLGYTIVGNYGDQWSDLMGGHSEQWVKLPNSAYYLPSDDLPDWAEKDRLAGMQPPSASFVLAPDGSTGRAPGVKGDDIPNMDVVKATIRHYYNAKKADHGVYTEDRTDSPYIREMKTLTDRWSREVQQQCSAESAQGRKPAVVFDTDDTTLWTYAMRETLHFNRDSNEERTYLKTDYHALPPVPGMLKVARAAQNAGCTIIGLTGRNDEYRDISLRNLAEAGYTGFTSDLYFTKPGALQSDMHPWVHCKFQRCTTVEYKAGTRDHIQKDLGYTIVNNFGDQWSDLDGGFAINHHKLPNPTYYIP